MLPGPDAKMPTGLILGIDLRVVWDVLECGWEYDSLAKLRDCDFGFSGDFEKEVGLKGREAYVESVKGWGRSSFSVRLSFASSAAILSSVLYRAIRYQSEHRYQGRG